MKKIRVQTSHKCGCGMFPQIFADGSCNWSQILTFGAAPECGYDGPYCEIFFDDRLL